MYKGFAKSVLTTVIVALIIWVVATVISYNQFSLAPSWNILSILVVLALLSGAICGYFVEKAKIKRKVWMKGALLGVAFAFIFSLASGFILLQSGGFSLIF